MAEILATSEEIHEVERRSAETGFYNPYHWRSFVMVGDNTAERIRYLAHELNVNESRIVTIAVDFYELCRNMIRQDEMEANLKVELADGLAGESRDDIEEVGVVGEIER